MIRALNEKVGTGTETVWLSVLLDGSSASEISNISLGDSLFIGQGGKDDGATTWQLSDQDGLVSDTGISSSALAFLLLRVDFSSGDESAWLWVNPLLDAEPDIGSADARGSIKEFEFDFLQIQLESSAFSGVDEVSLASSHAEVARLINSPEPSPIVLIGAGLIAMAAHRRRDSRE